MLNPSKTFHDIKNKLIWNFQLEGIERNFLLHYLEKLQELDTIVNKTTEALYKQFEEDCCDGCGFAMKCVDEDGTKNYEYSKCFKYYAKENCSNAEKTFLKTKFGWDFK